MINANLFFDFIASQDIGPPSDAVGAEFSFRGFAVRPGFLWPQFRFSSRREFGFTGYILNGMLSTFFFPCSTLLPTLLPPTTGLFAPVVDMHRRGGGH